MNQDVTAADLLPEFESAPELVNGGRYVVAQHGPDERLNIFSHYPLYREETDSWAFPNGDQVRSSEDYWLLESEFSGAMERAQERRQTLPVATGSHRPEAVANSIKPSPIALKNRGPRFTLRLRKWLRQT